MLAQDFSLYLHRPTATDPSLAPPGCHTFYVLSPVPHLQSGTDWRERAEPYLTDPKKVKAIVDEGTDRARSVAQNTMQDVRAAMGVGPRG